MSIVTPGVAVRERSYVRVQGPDAVEYLNRMLSNDVPEEGSVDALLLTAKARVIAPLLVWRRGGDDVLLLTEPELGDVVSAQLARMRFAAKCEIAPEEHTSVVVLGDGDAPEPETPVVLDGKDVGRVTSAVPGLALAYVRVEVAADATLDVGGRRARLRSSTATLTAPRRP